MPEKSKITKRFVDTLPFPKTGQKIYQDSELRGFAIRVTPTMKTFIINRKFNSKTVRHKISSYPEITAEMARDEAQKILGDLSKGIMPKDKLLKQANEATTLEKAFSDYVQDKQLKPKTLKDYHDVMRLQLESLSKKKLVEIKRSDVLELHKKLSLRSLARANLAMRLLKAIYNYSMEKYRLSDDTPLIIENPVRAMDGTKSWNRIKRRTRMVSVQELPDWHRALTSLEDSKKNNYDVTRDFLLFTLFTGLRRTEAMTLNWKNVDLRRKVFTIKDTKNHLEHVLPISNYLMTLLKRRQLNNPVNLPYVFPDKTQTTHLKEPKSVIKKVIELSKVEFSAHDLRRTFITIAESLNISHYALKRLLNHKEGNDVTSGYIIDDVERLRAPMEGISNRLLQLLNGESVSE